MAATVSGSHSLLGDGGREQDLGLSSHGPGELPYFHFLCSGDRAGRFLCGGGAECRMAGRRKEEAAFSGVLSG